jgi:nicotinamidase-related amidase
LTEHYSVLAPEVEALGGQSVGAFNESLFTTLLEYDRVYVFGQAKSHCVRSTLYDLRDRIAATDPALMGRIWILQDAMSPVPPPPVEPLPAALDFPSLAEEMLKDMAQAGMHVVSTTDPLGV